MSPEQRAYHKQWREKNREKTRAASARWRARNPEKVKADNRKWHAANSEQSRANHIRWKAENPDYQRQHAWLRKYGLSAIEFYTMLRVQRGCCAICSKQFDSDAPRGSPNKPHIDHNHSTGKVRALLCSGCNFGVGQFKELADSMRKAAAYVETHSRQLCGGTP